MLGRWAMRFGGALLFVVLTALMTEPAQAGGGIGDFCRFFLGFYLRPATVRPAKPTFAEIQIHNQRLVLKNFDILNGIGAKPAKKYADVDVYPEPDGFKRNVMWEELLDEAERLKLPRFIVTLPVDVRLAVSPPMDGFAEWISFAKGSTIALWEGGQIEYLQPVDVRDLSLFPIFYW